MLSNMNVRINSEGILNSELIVDDTGIATKREEQPNNPKERELNIKSPNRDHLAWKDCEVRR